MTSKTTIALADLVEKGADSEPMRDMIHYIARRMRAALGAGAVDLKSPKLRKGSYFPGFVEPRSAGEKGAGCGDPGSVIQGVSTRSVDVSVDRCDLPGGPGGPDKGLEAAAAKMLRATWQRQKCPVSTGQT